MHNQLRILLLFDVPFLAEPGYDFNHELNHLEEYRCERDVLMALRKLGHQVKPFGIYNNVEEVISELKSNHYDLVFFQCESVANERNHAAALVSILEILNVKYTGADPDSMRICKDKSLTKKILSYHDIAVPQFQVIKYGTKPSFASNFPFPAIVKPATLEASEGISQASLVHSHKAAERRCQFIMDHFEDDVIVEEFIHGRELYVGVLGNERITVFPPRELLFTKHTKDKPLIATYKAKWDHE